MFARACRCGGTIRDGKCDRCVEAWRSRKPDTGSKWRHLYKSSRWEKARLAYIAAHPLCAECERQGRTRSGNQLDHVVPHNGDMSLFWDSTNWQTLCPECHGAKTRRGE